jgi:predicted amidohydrolase
MARVIRVAGAQLGPIQRADPRALTQGRLLALLEEAAARGAELVVFPELAFITFSQQLEKRYFEDGNLGFPAFRVDRWHDAIVGMMICNDRRWPEAWRVLGLQSVELVLAGYNSPAYDPNGGESEGAELRTFHSQLVVQANAYMNATWAVAVAKAGNEDGAGLIGGSCIVDPDGRIVVEAKGLGDEISIADCDLDSRQNQDVRLCGPPAAGLVWADHRSDWCRPSGLEIDHVRANVRE